MKKYNSKNERVKREYLSYLAEADGKSAPTIEAVQKSLLRFEKYNKLKDFATFNREQAIGFKKAIESTRTERSGVRLSKATILTTLRHLREFFKWLAQQPGYKSKIHLPDISYFNLRDKEVRAARAVKMKTFPTLAQIHQVLANMPDRDETAKRNRALIAFTILTGARAQALISLKLKHIDLERNLVNQDPREVKTKFSKQINTFFFPVGEEIRKIIMDWVAYLINKKLYDYEAPLFPRTRMTHNKELSFKAEGLEPIHWTTTSPIRKIFKEAFEFVGLPYYNPHSFRDTLVRLSNRFCNKPEEFKAWSQNLGHESVSITLDNYGNMDPYRQGELLQDMRYDQSSKKDYPLPFNNSKGETSKISAMASNS